MGDKIRTNFYSRAAEPGPCLYCKKSTYMECTRCHGYVCGKCVKRHPLHESGLV